MAIIKCKMCGGDLNLVEGASTAECEFCGSVQTVPKVDDEKKLTLFARGNRLRAACEFDKAAGIYESIVADFPEEAEAYWGLVLCKYGIEYVDDPGSGKKIPTCHRSSFDSIMEDSDFEQALENADGAARKVYREEAKQIEELRKNIIAVSNNEQPYDIFICYKETDDKGDRTLDSVLAQDIYDALTDKGYRVFFARITLEDKLGQEYEPYIFAALNSAKIMLAVGTDYEYYNAVWVKNEWSRFLKLMAKDKAKHLIPCFKGIDAYDMPKEFAKLQAQDLGKVGATQDLLRGIEKLLPRQNVAQATDTTVETKVIVKETVVAAANPTVDSYLKRAFMFLEGKEWESANEYCEKVLDIDPENAQAYLGKLLAELKLRCVKGLPICTGYIEQNSNYKMFLRFADGALKQEVCALIAIKNDPDMVKKRTEFSQNAEIKGDELVRYKGDEAHVCIPYGIATIGSHAFYSPENLISIAIPDSVTTIEDWAFSYCENLTSITIPDSVTTIGERAFVWCANLTSITIPESVTTLGNWTFQGCENLTSITLPGGITTIGECAFEFCKRLTSITIPGGLIDIGLGAFAGCNQLNIAVSTDNQNFRVIDGCLVDVRRKTIIHAMKDAKIPTDGSVTGIEEEAFTYNDNLIAVTILDCIQSIGNYAFTWCKKLETITLPDSVTHIGTGAFTGCPELNIEVSENNRHFHIVDGCLIDVRNKELIYGSLNGKIPSDGSVIRIGKAAYAGCEPLTSITLPECITTIGEVAFSGCKNLTSVTIPESVTSIGEDAFRWCHENLCIDTPHDSYATQWGKRNNIHVEDMALQKQLEERLAQQDLEEQKRQLWQKQQQFWRLNRCCQHCGGEFKGVFTKKCVSCGKPKDY